MLIFFDLGIIGTLFRFINLDKVNPGWSAEVLLIAFVKLNPGCSADLYLDIPIFPVCHSLAKGQYCLCCTIFLNVRFILGSQGTADLLRACTNNFWQRPSIVRTSPCFNSTVCSSLWSLACNTKVLVAPSEIDIIVEEIVSA